MYRRYDTRLIVTALSADNRLPVGTDFILFLCPECENDLVSSVGRALDF
jgi:predicted RNA-binding Zn-ribbon protein involved in translation (DUF1610 family)